MNTKNNSNKIILLSVLSIIFVAITFLIVNNNGFVINFDGQTKTFIENIRLPYLDSMMLFVTKLGNVYEALFIFSLFAIILLINKKKDQFWGLVMASALGAGLPQIIKVIVHRARPISSMLTETDTSFPSGHATLATVFILTSIILIAPLIKNKILKIIFISITSIVFTLVAFSRIYLSVHWTSDVFAGILLGIISFFTAILCCQEKKNVL